MTRDNVFNFDVDSDKYVVVNFPEDALTKAEGESRQVLIDKAKNQGEVFDEEDAVCFYSVMDCPRGKVLCSFGEVMNVLIEQARANGDKLPIGILQVGYEKKVEILRTSEQSQSKEGERTK